jgi:stage III sporulation protein AE
MLAFVGYLTVSGVIAGSADAVAIKAAKSRRLRMVPVVGGILSDAAETVLAAPGF